MRISDWSSDVCSSDLMGYNVRFRRSACMSDPIPTDAELRSIVDAVGTRLRESRDLLVTAESCTGGWLAKTATDIAGSPDWFDCGMVAYSYEPKHALLGVRSDTADERKSGGLGKRG